MSLRSLSYRPSLTGPFLLCSEPSYQLRAPSTKVILGSQTAILEDIYFPQYLVSIKDHYPIVPISIWWHCIKLAF